MKCFHVSGYSRHGGHVKGHRRCIKGRTRKAKHRR